MNFRVPLSAALPAANVHFLTNPPTFTPTCPALGAAAAGHLCVYEVAGGGRALGAVFDPGVGAPGAAARGFGIYFDATGAACSYGQWATTAPAATPRSSPRAKDVGEPVPNRP